LLEEILGLHFPKIGADFTNLIYRFASYRKATGSAANMDHAARRLDKSSFANMMAGFFLVDH
jgi:hypothetical protein